MGIKILNSILGFLIWIGKHLKKWKFFLKKKIIENKLFLYIFKIPTPFKPQVSGKYNVDYFDDEFTKESIINF